VNVTVLDRDVSRIAKWQSPHLPIHEPGLGSVVRLTRDGGVATTQTTEKTPVRKANLFFSTNTATAIGVADVVFLAVNTPTKLSGRGGGRASDLAALEGAVRDIAQYARSGTILVEKSTVPCGTAILVDEIVSNGH
jgi:UDPglucose 6-dehydrogenase